MRRLGGGKSNVSASQRWKKQKTQKEDQTEEEKQKAAKNNENFLKLTGECSCCKKLVVAVYLFDILTLLLTNSVTAKPVSLFWNPILENIMEFMLLVHFLANHKNWGNVAYCCTFFAGSFVLSI